MLDYLIILALAYFIGVIPFGSLIKAKANIKIWFENDEPIGVMNIHRLLGMEWAILLLSGYFLKGYLGLWLSNYLWGNSFINLTSSLMTVIGQSNIRFSQERGGIMPVFIGVLYYWNSALAGLLASLWFSVYLLTRQIIFSTIVTVSAVPFILLAFDYEVDLVIFTLCTALFIIRYHIFTNRMGFAERGNYNDLR